MPKVSMTVNGRPASGEVEGRTLLVDFIRETLRLTGTHVGCDTAQCGACVVHLDGEPVKSCNVFALDVDGAEVRTIEGIANADGSLSVVQAAFQTHHGLQCGFCTPGMVMSATALLEREPEPERGRDPRVPRRQHLPLHRLPQHRQGHPGRRRRARLDARRRRITRPVQGGRTMPKDFGIGASVKRREDVRFLTGKGRYTDDFNRHGQTYVAFVRSDVAHGRIRSIDTSAAAAMPGVLKVFTAEDFASAGGIPCGWQIHDRAGDPMKEPKHPILAEGKVRHVGDPIAAVVAETLAQARDAAEAVVVDIEELPAVVDMRAALEPGAAAVHDDHPDNLCFDWGFIEDNREAVDAAIKAAPHVTTLELVNNRLIANPMEPRCAIGEYDSADDQHTLYTTSQNPHVIRLLMGAFVLGIPEQKLRVVAPDVGGGFGSKIFHYAEEAFVTAAAKAVGRPVKWTSTRSEAFMSDAHGRDHVTKIELALDKRRQVPRAAHRRPSPTWAPILSTFAPSIPTYLHGTLMAGNYTTPLIYVNVKAVFTNTVPGRRLPRRRPPRGDLPDRARHRQGGARARHRPDRDPPPELRQARPVPLPDAGRRQLRHRRLRRH